jgi:glycosyltransferase involved in cell wall biosynthesis
MSVYNRSEYLREAIESILSQTLKSFEFIIIDDGSTDGTWDILTEYAIQDQRIALVQNGKNLGLSQSLNKGLVLAQGNYIARQDADDVSLPKRLAAQIGYFEQQPRVGLLGTAYHIMNSQGQQQAVYRHPETDTEIRWQMLFHNAFCHSCVMFRREFLNRGDLFYDENLPCSQDYELWNRMLQQTSAANLKTPLVAWRKRGLLRLFRPGKSNTYYPTDQ